MSCHMADAENSFDIFMKVFVNNNIQIVLNVMLGWNAKNAIRYIYIYILFS